MSAVERARDACDVQIKLFAHGAVSGRFGNSQEGGGVVKTMATKEYGP